MLLAVEGGGFFSASASGYSKGLTLLLLGQKNEEKPMRVTPWSQYQLVDQESNSDLQLASGKKRLVRGCASFVCFRHTASGREGPSPLKVGPTQKQDVLPESPLFVNGKDDSKTNDPVDTDLNTKQVDLKSSLKKTTTSIPVSSGVDNESDAVSGKNCDVPSYIERRKVQWTDVTGGELVEVREFEPSGARELMCIRIIGASNRRYAHIGDVIVAVIKEAVPNMPLARSEVVRAVIVRTCKELKRDNVMMAQILNLTWGIRRRVCAA